MKLVQDIVTNSDKQFLYIKSYKWIGVWNKDDREIVMRVKADK
jgi:hypothetical protein